MERTKTSIPLSEQVKNKNTNKEKALLSYDGDFVKKVSTGSTLLDLAISGGRVQGGGLPGGILVEIFGPSGSGKTVLLSEIGGDIIRKGGELKFNDPEARLNPVFAKMFGLELEEKNYHRPNTVPDVFKAVRTWKPEGEGVIHGIMADSLAALSTDQEMDKEEGDKMGMRRAKEFSEELRKTCRILAQNNYLMVCSNQIRENVDPMSFQKYNSPGGLAIGFYSSLRLRTMFAKEKNVKKEKKFHGRDVTRIIGVNIEVEVFKNSIWKPSHSAPVTIIFDYGVDDIRQNLKFIKLYSGKNTYTLGVDSLGVSLEDAIKKIEDNGQEEVLRQEVIVLWNKLESQFDSNRKTKIR